MRRRSFIGTLTGAVIAGTNVASAASEARGVKPGDIPVRTFGKTGVKLTVIGQAGGRLLMVSEDDAKAVVMRAYELGINYFDNARGYHDGRSEEVYGKVLAPFRKKIFLTTKSYQRNAKDAERELNLSLKALQTDYVDLWQIHGVMELADVEQIFGPGGAIEAVEAAKKAGKCRFIGFTGHHDPYVHLEMLKRYDKYDTILMPLHVADPAYLSFEKLVLPIAVERGMGIQGMKNFGNAKLLQSFSAKECLSYVLSLPIHCTAIGCTTVGQVEDDVRIVQQFKPLTEAQMVELRDRAKEIKGPQLEDWKRNIEVHAQIPTAYRGA
jgi:predicted aldo/keto reductase-like oxidoreductase